MVGTRQGLLFQNIPLRRKEKKTWLLLALPWLLMCLCVLLLLCAVASLTSFQWGFVAGGSRQMPHGGWPGFPQTCFSVKVFCKRYVVGEEGKGLKKV